MLNSNRGNETTFVHLNPISFHASRHANPQLYCPFPPVPEAQTWLELFEDPSLPILVVLGSSPAGKTEWAKSLFSKPLELKIGTSQFFLMPCVTSSGMFTTAWCWMISETFSFLLTIRRTCRASTTRWSTAGGTCAYHVDLFGIPVVATANFSTKNLAFLEMHDWLANPGNRVLVHLQ